MKIINSIEKYIQGKEYKIGSNFIYENNIFKVVKPEYIGTCTGCDFIILNINCNMMRTKCHNCIFKKDENNK